MFKKIHSNRDPRDTLFSELKKEFRPYVHKAGSGLKSVAESHPKFLFAMMVINILLSVVLVLTVFRHHPDAVKKPPKGLLAPAANGLSQVMQAGAAIKEIFSLKKAVDSLSAKKTLSQQDSIYLDSALDRLQFLTKQFNHHEH